MLSAVNSRVRLGGFEGVEKKKTPAMCWQCAGADHPLGS